MGAINKVIWLEGMHLQPHHFQQQDRYFESLIIRQIEARLEYAWGIVELEIDLHLLALGKLVILRCLAILPDGTIVDIPNQDEAPLPLDIPTDLTNTKIYLALPLKRENSAEAGFNQPQYQLCRYNVKDYEVRDSNANCETVAMLHTGRLILRLMFEYEDRQAYSCLALCRIAETHSDSHLLIDEYYFPACMNIQVIKPLANFLEELRSLLNYRGEKLVQRLTEASTGGIAEISDFIMLQLINRYEPIIRHFLTQKKLHPLQLYLILLQLTGELATFTTKTRKASQVTNYQHENLANTFLPIIEEIRRALSIVLEESAVSIKLERQQLNTWVAIVADKSLFNMALFVLAIKANTQPQNLKNQLPGQVKISPGEELRNLINRALPGIELEPLVTAPRQIPFYTNYHYFALNRTNQLWHQLEKSSGLAIHVSGNYEGLELELWAIKDNIK